MKYVIIGGVAGGATVAARLRRMDEHCSITLFEKGNDISYANCGLPYYVGDTISSRNSLLLQTPESFQRRFNVDVRVRSEVLAIHREKKTVTYQVRGENVQREETYDKLVLSPGSVAIRPDIPGINDSNIFVVKEMTDADAVKERFSFLKKEKKEPRILIVGSGFIGLEMTENFSSENTVTYLVEKASHVLPAVDLEIAAPLQAHLRAKSVNVFTDNGIARFEKKGEQTIAVLESGESLEIDLAVIGAGVRPRAELAVAAGLEIGEWGGIVVDEFMRTSDPDIYAVGDVVETIHPITKKRQLMPLAGPTNKQARTCADNIIDGNIHPYHGSIGTGIAKVFDLSVGMTGLTEKKLQQLNIPYLTSITHTASHASYYPGSTLVTTKLQYAPQTGHLLGAEVIGTDGVDKRLDVYANLIARQGTVFDLTQFDHSYAPPFSSAKDAATMAGCVAENILRGKMQPISCRELRSLLLHKKEKDFLLLDVRSFLEHKSGAIEDSVNIPLDTLRERLTELPKDKLIIIYCAVGQRGYFATRILLQNGFNNVKNLVGGYRTWKDVVQMGEKYFQN